MRSVFILICILIGCACPETEGEAETTAAVSTEPPLSSSQLFTFAQPQSFLQLQPGWELPATREVTFQFRTDRPHGLLLYHGTISTVGTFPFYELYVMLENGQIKIIHVFHSDGQNETFFIGKGLNRDKWHHVTLRINPSAALLFVRVDDIERTESLPSLLHTHSAKYSVENNSQTVMYFGGLDPNSYAINQKYNYVRFIGCLGNIMFNQFSHPFAHTKVIVANQLFYDYVDMCQKHNPCLYNGHCINHYTHTSCDCFGTKHEDSMCYYSHPATVTLRGYSYITYRVYDWRDRVHSEVTRVSFTFRTYFENSVLLHASGTHPLQNYVSISLYNKQLYFEIDFGDGPLNYTIGYSLNNEEWHTFTMHHRGKHLSLKLDNKWETAITATGTNHHLHLDPEIFIGYAPEKAQGFQSREKFIGCFQNVYFNDKSILYALQSGESTARYHSIFSVEWGCKPSNVIPITFPLPESKLVLNLPSTNRIQMSLEFKTSQANCVLASGAIHTERKSTGFWELLLHNGVAEFVIESDSEEGQRWSLTDEKSGKNLADEQWHQIGIVFESGETTLEIDYIHKSSGVFSDPIDFDEEMIVTTSIINKERGFIGCIRDIFLFGEWIDPRTIVDTKQVSGKVSLDNCELVNLCNNPHACEHGGRCYVEKGETHCDCANTGYTGRTCHFSLYKRTCEELYLVGYRKNGVYTIDIDRNGPMPPAHVHCEVNLEKGIIATKVENNMKQEMGVRKPGMQSFYIDITYREFTPQMLQSLVKHSKQCFQTVKYECFRTPLGLRTYTWMESSGTDEYITSFGSKIEGCKCAETKSCENSSYLCNCDTADARWRVDEGNFTNPKHLGITRFYILQPKNLESGAEGQLTLGPLECLETDTQKYIITFKTPNSYIEVPGWRRGDIAFSFRTSNSQAVLIYQASIHSSYGYLRVLLVNDYELSFEYTVNNKPSSTRVTSRRKLNSGEWQQVWVDHDRYHMRFTVNLDSVMIDYGEEDGVGPFEGPLHVGGVPELYAGNSAIKEGFIGCFRGLVINDVVVDLYKLMTRSESAIVLGCQPSCGSNPCRNGATCHEFWGSYMCECKNPYAHSGKNCEINVNTNGFTVVSPGSYYHHKSEGSAMHPILEKNFLLSFRTFEQEGIILYAFDHFNNFVQLHFSDKVVYFTFNSDRTINQIAVKVPELSRGFPIQVKVDRQLQSTNLTVKVGYRDGPAVSATANVKMNFVDKYFRMPWIQGQELEIIYPPRGAYRTIDHSEMFLGHVGSGTETNITDGGFVGCIQGLKIGDDIFDLETAAKTKNSDEIFGNIKPGCSMLCDEQPCQNDGLCIEHWRENMTSCDCTLTSYTGDICHKDIGGSFDGKSALTYRFDGEPVKSDNVAVRLAFSTETESSLFQVLFFMHYLGSKFILIGISKDNSLFIDENIGTSVVRRIAKTNSTWSSGNRHWVYFSKQSDDVTFIVDGHPYINFMQVVEPLSRKLEGRNTIYLSALPKTVQTFGQYVNFKGCISNVMIEFGKHKITPLETAFGYQKGELSKVKVDNSVTEKKCASIAVLSQLRASLPPVLPDEENDGQQWFKEAPVLVPFESVFSKMKSNNLEEIQKNSAKVAVVMGIMLILVLFGLLVYLYRIHIRHKKEKNEDYQVYKGKRRPTGLAVSFSPNDEEKGEDSEVQPLTWAQIPPTPVERNFKSGLEFSRNSIKLPKNKHATMRAHDKNSIELASLKATSSQELEWDPAGAQLLNSTLDHMNPTESSEPDLREAADREGPLPNLKSQVAPLATASEKRLRFQLDGRTGNVDFADEQLTG